MNKTKTKPIRTETRTIAVPKEIHQRVAIAAAYRDQDIRTVAVQALTAGLSTLELTPQPSNN